MELNKHLDVSPEVAEALAAGKPVVALESTIISHGMPYPQNVQTALAVEKVIRDNGAVPATLCIINGRLKAGCTPEEIGRFAAEPWAKRMTISEKTVNLKLFRAATEHYLRSRSEVNSDMMLMVRQLEPTPEGLPLQLYFFTTAKDWVPHEHIAADVMEQVIARMYQFGLKVYQKPSGADMADLGRKLG